MNINAKLNAFGHIEKWLLNNCTIVLLKKAMNLSAADIDRIIEMAWEDRTPFEAITMQFGLPEKEVIELMRKHMKKSSFNMWRKRMAGRKTKHSLLRSTDVARFKCSRQRTISLNKISKK